MHYYFDRTLHDKEAVGIISGHKEFEARHLPGYAGEITEVESLVPTLANVKQGLIKTHLCWGGSSKS